ncbi:solute carrier family 22 member 15-like isoform X4 [Haemaphysalis longicornis]
MYLLRLGLFRLLLRLLRCFTNRRLPSAASFLLPRVIKTHLRFLECALTQRGPFSCTYDGFLSTQINFARPPFRRALPRIHEKGTLRPSGCEMYAFQEGRDGSLRFLNNSRVRCSRWEYDLKGNTNTLTNTVRSPTLLGVHAPPSRGGRPDDNLRTHLLAIQHGPPYRLHWHRGHPEHHVHHRFMPESPMWLLATKHYKDAEEVLIAAVRKNKVSGADVSAIIKRYEDKMESERSLTKPTFAALFRYRCIRKTSIIISVKSILSTLLYYNLTYTSILLGSNPYITFAVMACMEYPQKVVAIFFINAMKRRTAYIFLYISAALCSVAVIFIPPGIWWLQLCFMLVTKMFSSCASSVTFVQISELYPTQVRTLANGWSITTSRVGAILAPFTKELAIVVGPWAPKAVDCAVCVLSVILALMLPETFKVTLPDTVDDIKRRSLKKRATVASEVSQAEGQPCVKKPGEDRVEGEEML